MTTLLRRMWKNHSKHKKLSEEWALAECEGDGWWRETKAAGGQTDVRYAGVAPVERAASAPATALAVRSALQSAKSLNKKPQRVNLDISPKGIVVSDADTDENVLSISIYSSEMTTLLRRMWKNHSKHKKLSEEWALAECEGDGWWRETKAAGGQTDVRYAGVAPVERAASAPATALAVRSALQSAKSLNKKPQRVNLDISPKGIVVSDADTDENVLSISIYRISYCSADAANARVLAVVEGKSGSGSGSESHVVHAFVCARRKQARALALSLAHAFNDAYQSWQSNQSSSLHSGEKRRAPWVSFPDDSDLEEDDQWQDPAPLVSFA